MENQAERYFSAAAHLYDLDRYEQALQKFEMALQSDPEHTSSFAGIALCKRELEKYDEALAASDQALQKDPNNKLYLFSRSIIYWRIDDVETSIDLLQQCLALDPEYLIAFNQLSLIYWHQLQYEDARQMAMLALSVHPNSSDAHINLGKALFKLEQNEEASRCFEKALELEPENAEAHRYLGRISYSEADYGSAQTKFEETLRLDPLNESAQIDLMKAEMVNIIAQSSDKPERLSRLSWNFKLCGLGKSGRRQISLWLLFAALLFLALYCSYAGKNSFLDLMEWIIILSCLGGSIYFLMIKPILDLDFSTVHAAKISLNIVRRELLLPYDYVLIRESNER